MFNKDISDKLIELYGEENVILFSKMESTKNSLIFDELEANCYNVIEEHSFERDWWRENGARLEGTRVNNLKKENNASTRAIGNLR
jgi:hypothetical protein